MFKTLRNRLLNSLAFRSGYRLISADDPRVRSADFPDIRALQLSAIHPSQLRSSGTTSDLIQQILPVITVACEINLDAIESRIDETHPVKGITNNWPGNHYRLLAAFVKHFKPKSVIEVGTFTGVSFLSLTECLASDASLVTYDIVPFDRITGTHLRKTDFNTTNRQQIVGDLANEEFFRTQADRFRNCDLLFVDGPKDNQFEYQFWDLLTRSGLKPGCFVIFDDIRLVQMLRFWNDLKLPKLDLVSFGHYTGTGVFIWTP